MENFRKRLEQTMNAMAFAESGEFNTALEFLQDSRKKNKATGKKVVLAVESTPPDNRLICHVLQLATRLGASLEIFQVLSPDDQKGSAIIDPRQLPGEDIEVVTRSRTGELANDIIKHVAFRRNIQCLVMESSAIPQEKDPKKKSPLLRVLARLGCQLLLYDAQVLAAQKECREKPCALQQHDYLASGSIAPLQCYPSPS